MLKTVFSRFFVAFTVIIAVSFLILTIMISSMVSEYSAKAKNESLQLLACSVREQTQADFASAPSASFQESVAEGRDQIRSILQLLARNTSDTVIWLLDADNRVILSSEGDGGSEGAALTLPDWKPDEATDSASALSDLGILPTACPVCYAPIRSSDGTVCGAVLVLSSNTGLVGLVETLMKTFLLSCLWVLIAAMLTVFFISEKISSPLKTMGIAAKQYAQGKFDVRVPVRGNDEIAELAKAFNNMAQSLANVENTRQSFLANVSHDLRTPMTTISGFIDGILDGAIPEEKQSYYLGIIASEVRRLSRLVSSLLDISKIQAGERKFTKTAFDICEMARQILISFEQRIDEKKLDVSFECSRDNMTVYADRDAIHQVLYNLCDNGVKFAREGGAFRIRIEESDRRVSVSVYNEGDGIPEEELPFVFDRFYKSDRSRGLDKTGVGLGLYIAKTILDAHGQDISVHSVFGQYCEFIFTLQSVLSDRGERNGAT